MKREALYAENLVTDRVGGQNLEGISFFLNEGEILGIVGLNGSGVATLADVLTGRTPLRSGHIYINGREIAGGSRERMEKHGVYEIGGDLTVVDRLSCSENLTLLRRGRSFLIHRKRDLETARRVFEHYQLGAEPRQPASRLDLCQIEELAICRALLDGAKILVCRSIGDAFSEAEKDAFAAFLRRLTSEGFSILLIGTSLRLIQNYSDRLIVVRSGMVCAMRRSAELSRAKVRRYLDVPPRDTFAFTGPGQLARYSVPMEFHDLCTPAGLRLPRLKLEPGQALGLVCGQRHAVEQIFALFSGTQTASGSVMESQQDLSFSRWYRQNRRRVFALRSRFWERSVFENLTLGENIALGAYPRFRGILNGRMLSLALSEFAETHDVPVEYINGYPRHIPEEVCEQIPLWRLLFVPPKLLVLVNPLYMADEKLRRLLGRTLDELKSAGTAILWCGSEELSMSHYCDAIRYDAGTGDGPDRADEA